MPEHRQFGCIPQQESSATLFHMKNLLVLNAQDFMMQAPEHFRMRPDIGDSNGEDAVSWGQCMAPILKLPAFGFGFQRAHTCCNGLQSGLSGAPRFFWGTRLRRNESIITGLLFSHYPYP